MATKTLTITEDAYNILAARKLDDESFSQEIKRLFSEKTKKKLSEFAGILSDADADAMRKDLLMFKETNIALQKEKLKRQGFI